MFRWEGIWILPEAAFSFSASAEGLEVGAGSSFFNSS
jgi:hypothetical protein